LQITKVEKVRFADDAEEQKKSVKILDETDVCGNKKTDWISRSKRR